MLSEISTNEFVNSIKISRLWLLLIEYSYYLLQYFGNAVLITELFLERVDLILLNSTWAPPLYRPETNNDFLLHFFNNLPLKGNFCIWTGVRPLAGKWGSHWLIYTLIVDFMTAECPFEHEISYQDRSSAFTLQTLNSIFSKQHFSSSRKWHLQHHLRYQLQFWKPLKYTFLDSFNWN